LGLKKQAIRWKRYSYGITGSIIVLHAAPVRSGAKEKGVIYGMGAWNIGDIKGSTAMNQAFEMGKTHRVKEMA